MKHILFFGGLLFIFSCNKENFFGGPNYYSDDFESYETIDSAIDGNDLKWSFFQQTLAENSAVVDTVNAHSGSQSIRFFASASSENGVSKSCLVKQKMAFFEGDIVRVEMWYYIEGTSAADWLFLFDLEEQPAIGAGPGMRLALVNDQLVVEHKFANPTLRQPEGLEKSVPRNTWFKITFETQLSQKDKGYVRVWQNDTLLIDQQDWTTLPSDFLYAQQGTKGMYTSVQFGLTANTRDNDMVLYMDDVSVQVLN